VEHLTSLSLDINGGKKSREILIQNVPVCHEKSWYSIKFCTFFWPFISWNGWKFDFYL